MTTGWDYIRAVIDLNLGTQDEPLALAPSLKLMMFAYAVHADGTGRCWPGIDRMTRVTGLGRTEIYARRRELIRLGLLKVVEVRSNRPEGTDRRRLTDVLRICSDLDGMAMRWSDSDRARFTRKAPQSVRHTGQVVEESVRHTDTDQVNQSGIADKPVRHTDTQHSRTQNSSEAERDKEGSPTEGDDLSDLRDRFDRVWRASVSSSPMNWSEVEPPVRRALGWGFSAEDLGEAMVAALGGDSSRYRTDERKQSPRYWLSSPDHIRDLIAQAAEERKKYANHWIGEDA
jgi:hypothetical protein